MAMLTVRHMLLVPLAILLISVQDSMPQSGDLCREFGVTPNRDLDDRGRLASFVFGRITLLGIGPDSKLPLLVAQYSDTGQPGSRQRIGRSGNYCFRRYGSGGTVVIEIDGLEAARRAIPETPGNQHREDFEIDLSRVRRPAPPGVVSVNDARTPAPGTIELYERAISSEKAGRTGEAIDAVREIVRLAPSDFVAWTKLGALYQGTGKTLEAETSFKRALEINKDYIPALLNYGILKAMSADHKSAIELFLRATVPDPFHARAFRLLGEAYLQNRQGSLGLAALDKALALDPEGMAECHLLKARLYDLAGAKKEAAEEYRQFLRKVPKYKDRKVLEAYISENGG